MTGCPPRRRGRAVALGALAFAAGSSASSAPPGVLEGGTSRAWVGLHDEQCAAWNPIEERTGETLEALLLEDACPFVVAFFSSSSPLAQSEELARMEQQTASAFPEMKYVRVDADQLGIRAFLQWDITFLPTYVVSVPAEKGQPRQWIRWKGEGETNPYDHASVTAFVARATGLRAGNTSSFSAGPVPPRGSPGMSALQLGVCWVLLALTAAHRMIGGAWATPTT
mmetsp:Transcript_111250/g.314905  ORF Transcript_111250/g.314905 Transcript_111250/m.314905 type:complete len:225 (-) Transcript_111250:108-782(-)